MKQGYIQPSSFKNAITTKTVIVGKSINGKPIDIILFCHTRFIEYSNILFLINFRLYVF